MGDNLEGYLQKKAGNITARWLKRYYHFNEGEKRLVYWQKEEHKKKGQTPKGEIKADEIEKVYPDPEKRDRFTLVMKNKSTVFRAENDVDKWVRGINKFVKQDSKHDTGFVDDEDTASWTTEQIVEMMNTGQIMTAYFSNNTKKNFTLYCKELVLYACPVNAGIDKAIINLPLRRISDIYVGKQTPGFDTEVAAPVPFDRCFTIISRKYTLDVEAKSYQMATHWLAGIKYLLTMSGKAVIVNEQEAAGSKPAEDQGTTDGAKGTESTPSESNETQADGNLAAEKAAEQAIIAAKLISPDNQTDDNNDLELEIEQDDENKGKRKVALLIIDVQNDFLPPEGSLAVKDGLDVIPVINKLHKRVAWTLVAVSQDWHPANHVSFFLNNKDNPKAKLLEVLTLPDGREQMMWPAHCVQLSKGAEFHHDLILETNDKFVRKGTRADVDSYSAFYDNDHKTKTELADLLNKAGITDVVITGLAYDYCVAYSALDAVKEGFRTWVVEDATRGVHEETVKKMKAQLREAGVNIISSDQIPDSGLIPDGAERKEEDDKEDDEKAVVDEEGDSDTEEPTPVTQAPIQLGVDDFLSQNFLVAPENQETSNQPADGGAEEHHQETHEEHHGEQSEEPHEEPTEPETHTEEPKPDEKTDTTTQPKKAGTDKPVSTAKPTTTTPKPGVKPATTTPKPGVKPATTTPKPGAKPVTGAKPVAGKPGAKPVTGAKPVAGKPGAKPSDGKKPGPIKSPTTVKIHAVPPKKPVAKKPVGKPGAKPVAGKKPGVAGPSKTPGKPGVAPGKPGTTPAKKPGAPGVGTKPVTPGTQPAKKPGTTPGATGSPTKPVKKPDGKTDGKTAKPTDGKKAPGTPATGVTSPTTAPAKKPGVGTPGTAAKPGVKPTTPGTAAKPGVAKPGAPKTPSASTPSTST